MAIALRGALNHITNKVNNGNDVTLTFDTITPPLENDVVIVFGGHGVAATTLAAPGTGYTQIGIHTGSAPIFGAWWKRMGATPDLSVVCSGGGDGADGVAYGCWVLSGVDETTVLDVSTTTAGPTTSTNPDGPSITPTTSGSWVISMSGGDIRDTSPGTISGYSNQLNQDGNDTNDITIGGGTFPWVSGAEDPPAWSSWGSSTWYSITAALREQADNDTTLTADGGSAALTGGVAALDVDMVVVGSALAASGGVASSTILQVADGGALAFTPAASTFTVNMPATGQALNLTGGDATLTVTEAGQALKMLYMGGRRWM